MAAAMAASTAFLIAWAAQARTAVRAAVVLFLLLMMAAMLAGAAVYYLAPSPTHLVEGLWVGSGLMSVSVIPLFLTVLREAAARAQDPGSPAAPIPRPRAFVAGVVALVLLNELLMGWTFSSAAGLPLGSLGANGSGFVTLLSQTVVSPWFVFTMALEMGLTVLLLRRSLPSAWQVVLGFQAIIMLLSPPALSASWWENPTALLSSGLMIALLVYLMEFIYRHRQLEPAFSEYIVLLTGVFALMMAGLYVWTADGSPILFAVSLLVEMLLFFPAVLRSEAPREGNVLPWQLHPRWALGLLGGIFVAELFMGAVLDLVLLPGVYASAFPALPMAGGAGTVAYNALYNGFWFVALVVGSTWFLAMMGVEMGVLVLFKMRETRRLETRIRLGLMLGSYAAFATFFPSVYYATLFPRAPTGTAVP
ncbi:MAG: hypothetical protein L3K09_04915, partial [Thermoplasmata archaeon]|nr:hypothetical protein [Thermoplasmata archaeon]